MTKSPVRNIPMNAKTPIPFATASAQVAVEYQRFLDFLPEAAQKHVHPPFCR